MGREEIWQLRQAAESVSQAPCGGHAVWEERAPITRAWSGAQWTQGPALILPSGLCMSFYGLGKTDQPLSHLRSHTVWGVRINVKMFLIFVLISFFLFSLF